MDKQKKYLHFSPILQSQEGSLRQMLQSSHGTINTLQAHYNFIKN